MRSIAAYTERVLSSSRDRDAMAAIEAARRKAGLDLTNVQSAVQRSLSEAEDEVDKREAGLLAGWESATAHERALMREARRHASG